MSTPPRPARNSQGRRGKPASGGALTPVLAGRRWAGVAVVLAVLVAGAPAADAAPTTSQQARREAETVARRVDELTALLGEQVAAEEAALAGVAAGVQHSIGADTEAESARRDAARARARQARTVRALYSLGGELGLYASVLGATSVQDALGRTMLVQRVLADATRDAEAATAAARDAGGRAVAADDALADRLATAADVAEASRAVEATLGQARASLASLTEQAARLAAAEEARRRFEVAERAAAAARTAAAAAAASRVTAIGIPEAFQAWYVAAAATCPGMRWTLLAAVGQVESRHGAVNGPSSAGAIGPMQFMPATFAAFGVDGGGDGVADPWDPADAIFSAAAYLCRNGAGTGTPQGVRRALLRYNNAQWYVDLVLGVEADLLARGA